MFIRRINDIEMGGKKIEYLGDPVKKKDAMNLKKINTKIAILEEK